MSVLSISYFGPVRTGVYNLTPEWSADPVNGRAGATFTGRITKAQAEQLHELVNNPDAALTIGGLKGVLAPFWSESPKARAFIGWYLLTDEDHSPDFMGDGVRTVPFSLKGIYLGDTPQAVAARSSVPKGNDFSLTAKSTVVSPFRPSGDSGEEFLTAPGGTFATRAYDPTYPRDVSVPAPSDTAAIGLYVGTVTDDDDDDISSVVYPLFNLGKDEPLWLSQQGGNVRAFDRRADREVYGPHPFLETTDILVTNGLVEFWVGNRGLVPYLNVRAFDGTTWREEGTVQLGTSAVLRGARVQSVTSEAAVVALAIAGQGEALVTLKRGEPFIRILSPDASIRPTWSGTPPTSRAVQAANATGKFGKGLDGGVTVNNDIRFFWPPTVQDEWTRSLWLRAGSDASATAGAGYLTVYGQSGEALLVVFFDDATNTIRAEMGATTLTSSAQTFTSGQDLLLVARFSTTHGLAFSIRSPVGTWEHLANTGATVLGGIPLDVAYLANFSAFGDGDFGDGDFGGTTYYPEGVIDNDLLFDEWLTTTEVEALGTATTPLGNMPAGKPPVWYAPFDLAPIVTLASESGGRRVDPVTDEWGFTKAVAFLDSDHTESGALLVGAASPDTAAELHAQLAAENDQQLRVR